MNNQCNFETEFGTELEEKEGVIQVRHTDGVPEDMVCPHSTSLKKFQNYSSLKTTCIDKLKLAWSKLTWGRGPVLSEETKMEWRDR